MENALPNSAFVIPFVVLLSLIALGPLFFSDWWAKRYPLVSMGLGAVVCAYYLISLHEPDRVAEVTFDYIRFIVLVGSLFTVSGGIHIKVKGEATPRANVAFLLIGAVVSNLIGTTGASMLLIRPWLRLNKYRITGYHVVFFIFIVSNVGGSLTPIGDPPLYLGYLKGVPFWWITGRGWPIWAVGVGILIAVFYFVDRHNYLRAPKPVRESLAEPPDHWRFQGLRNLIWLFVVLAAAFIQHPAGLREVVMVAAAVLSFYTTPKPVHESNHFNFHPIKEVAILFVGIFLTMTPALDLLQAKAHALGAPSPAFFYFGSGVLSSVLDNAPTYLTYFSAILGSHADPALAANLLDQIHGQIETTNAVRPEILSGTMVALKQYFPKELASGQLTLREVRLAILLGNIAYQKLILAISFGSVFFGANTYIGNGPNFMVKAIADHQKVHTPTFVGYVVRFTLPVMAPMLGIIWLLFFLH